MWRREFFEWEHEALWELLSLLNQSTVVSDVADKVVWVHHISGSYNVKSFFNLIHSSNGDDSGMHNYANVVWRSLTPPKSKLLLLFLMIGKLNTKDRLQRLNFMQGLESTCALCKVGTESIEHLFCYCPFTWKVWCSLLSWWGVS